MKSLPALGIVGLPFITPLSEGRASLLRCLPLPDSGGLLAWQRDNHRRQPSFSTWKVRSNYG